MDRHLEPIRRERILTIADMPGFIERGGIVNFLVKKTRFVLRSILLTPIGRNWRSDPNFSDWPNEYLTTDDVEEK
jgi:hypothetical protein